MDIRQLSYLKELVTRGSFSLAAQRLGISQPALSIRIKQLEEDCDLQLIDRSAKPIRLTSDGEHFFTQALEVLSAMETLEEIPLQLQQEISGTLRLGIIPTLAPYLLPLILPTIQRRYPSLELHVEEVLTAQMIHRIRSGHLQAGILSTPIEARGLAFQSLFYEKFHLYVSEKHPLFSMQRVAIEALDHGEIWYLQEGNCFSKQVNAICQLAGAGAPDQPLRYFSNSIESLRRIVERQGGMTFIPELATIDIPSEQEELIKDLKGTAPSREISVVCLPGFAQNRILAAFTDSCLSQIPRHMKQVPDGWVVEPSMKIE